MFSKVLITFLVLIALTVSNVLADEICLKNGSVVKGKITEQTPETIVITTFDGSVFVYKKSEVDQVTYSKIKSPTSGTLAVVLSLIYPGFGNYYVGRMDEGTGYLLVGTMGIGLMVYGMQENDDPLSDSAYKNANSAIVGCLFYLVATVQSCITAYKGAESYGSASLFKVNRSGYAIKVLPVSPIRNRQVLMSFNY